MGQPQSGERQRRWSDLGADEKAEIEASIWKGVRADPDVVDLAADRAASWTAIFSPAAWITSAMAALAVVDAWYFSGDGGFGWAFPAVTLVLAAGLHVVRVRYLKAQRINARVGRESPPDPELDHIVQLMRGSIRVQVALGGVVAVALFFGLWFLG